MFKRRRRNLSLSKRGNGVDRELSREEIEARAQALAKELFKRKPKKKNLLE